MRKESIQDQAFEDYKDAFVRDFSAPYGIQFPGRRWKTIPKPLPDHVVKGHLQGVHWVGTQAGWYPAYAYVDLDNLTERGREKLLDRVIERLRLDQSQYMLCTSPSWQETGNLHLVLAPRWNGKPPTKRGLKITLAKALRDLEVELYPGQSKIFRLPFGRDQHIYDEFTETPMVHLGWQEALDAVKRIDDLALENLPGQTELIYPYRSLGIEAWTPAQEAENLLEHGLQSPGTRHDACLLLGIYLYRRNHDPWYTQKTLRCWVREKHNGLSKEVNRGRWAFVDREIDDIVRWVYDRYNGLCIWPDSTHNAEGWLVADDIRMIGEVFRGNIVNQKRMFKLMLFYRPRQCHDWTFIPRRQWTQIASTRHYRSFQADLARRKILELPEGESYRIGGYPKRFRLYIPNISREAMLENDGRAIQDFAQACFNIYNSKQGIKEALGLSERTTYNLFKGHKKTGKNATHR